MRSASSWSALLRTSATQPGTNHLLPSAMVCFTGTGTWIMLSLYKRCPSSGPRMSNSQVGTGNVTFRTNCTVELNDELMPELVSSSSISPVSRFRRNDRRPPSAADPIQLATAGVGTDPGASALGADPPWMTDVA